MKLAVTSLLMILLGPAFELQAQEYDVTVVPHFYSQTLAKLFDSVSLNDGARVYANAAQHNIVRTFVDSTYEGLVLGAGWRGEVINPFDITQTFLNSPRGLATDGVKKVYVADSGNNRVLVTDVVAGIVGRVTIEILNNPTQVVRLENGDLLVLEASKDRIVRVDAAGKVTRFLGARRGKKLYPNSLAKSQLKSPQGMALWQGRLIVADTGNRRLIEVFGNKVKRFGANTNLFHDYERASSKMANGVKALTDGTLIIRESTDGKWEQYVLITPENDFSLKLKGIHKSGLQGGLSQQADAYTNAVLDSRNLPSKGTDIEALCQQIRARLVRHSLRDAWPRYYRKVKRQLKGGIPNVARGVNEEALIKKTKHGLGLV